MTAICHLQGEVVTLYSSWIVFPGQRKKLEEMKAEFEPLTKLMKEACEGLRVLGVLWSCRVGGCRALSEGFVFKVLGV